MARLLLVDDDDFMLAMTGAVLEDAGFEVITAGGGAEALARIAEQPEIGVVISDLYMPGMDGLQFYDQLRDQGWRRPFILLTGEEATGLGAGRELAAVLIKDEDLPEKLPRILKELL